MNNSSNDWLIEQIDESDHSRVEQLTNQMTDLGAAVGFGSSIPQILNLREVSC
jgi:hypothetical protein